MADRLRVIYPPDPNPRKPALVLPAGACDSHFHVFGPPDLFPYTEDRVYTPPAAPLEHALALFDILGISRGVVVQPFAHGTNNEVTLDAIARAGGRFRGVAKIDDSFSDDDLQRLHEGGIRGIRFNLFDARGGAVETAMFERLGARVAELGWSMTLHAHGENFIAHADWIGSLRTPVIIDHFARLKASDGIDQPGFGLLLGLMERENMWVKISCAERISLLGAPWPDVVPMARALIAAAPERVLWGTDWPHTQRYAPGLQPNDGDLVDALAGFAPDEAARRKILVDNPTKLFWAE